MNTMRFKLSRVRTRSRSLLKAGCGSEMMSVSVSRRNCKGESSGFCVFNWGSGRGEGLYGFRDYSCADEDIGVGGEDVDPGLWSHRARAKHWGRGEGLKAKKSV